MQDRTGERDGKGGSMDEGRKILLAAARAHVARTGHGVTMVGLNFVHCPVCKAHAHLDSGGHVLIAHDRGYSYHEPVRPEAF